MPERYEVGLIWKHWEIYYFVWFLVSSLILLVAMIGAIVLTMHRTTKVKRQDVFRRNAIDSRRTIMKRTFST
jgi:NADH-ubiquinone oxidoreductase chain 6